MTLLRLSWERWRRTRRLTRTVRRLRRLAARQEAALSLQREMLDLLDQLQQPILLAPPLESPTPTWEQMPPSLELPPPLTQEEMDTLRELPMPDPLEEIELRLGLSTSPPSPRTWED